MAVMTRKSVPISRDDAADVERLRRFALYREAAKAVAGVELSENSSEAEVLHALITAGRHALHEQVMVTGYGALAAAQTDEDRAIAREVTSRARLLGD
ncbi:MAG: hypothetical protein GEU93_02790 [Propionibacteriales bacterium]|nr:hypothetical protein [Propionibacteriales bacterium]